MKVLAISGSLRQGSYNTALLQALAAELPAHVEFEHYDGLRAVPPYDEDAETPAPAAVNELRGALAQADVVVFSTPEYNASIPGQLKNALDWASRPFATNPLRGKPVAVLSATTGQFGGVWANEHLRKVLGTLGARLVGPQVALPAAAGAFGDGGELRNPGVRRQLAQLAHDVVGAVDGAAVA